MSRGKLIVVVGGQFGSEGKGMIAGYLAAQEPEPLLAIRVAGPNAGHTVIDEAGEEWKLQQIPVAGVVNKTAQLAIAAGSEIDPEILFREIQRFHLDGHPGGLLVDEEATIIEPKHVIQERGAYDTQTIEGVRPLEHGAAGLTKRIGSTGKGVGAARAARLMREAKRVKDWDWPDWANRNTKQVAEEARRWLASGWTVMVEGTQGYGLGLHAGFYPYCTSSDCRAVDFLAMAGISPWADYVGRVEVWVCLRTMPIRVAGNSGPLEKELSWEQLEAQSGGYIKPELTTVTKKVRRIGDWDSELARRAIEANGGPGGNVHVALTFFDYWVPSMAGKIEMPAEEPGAWTMLHHVERVLEQSVELIGTGPRSVIDWRGGK